MNAIKNVVGLNYVNSILVTHYTYEVTIEYKYESALFYLGQQFQLQKQLMQLKS